MKIVIDTNILFSALLSKDNTAKTLLFNNKHELYTCNYLFVEIFRHKERVLQISALTEDDLLLQLENCMSRVNFIAEGIVPAEFYYKAFMMCKDVDEKDTPFVALSLFLDAPLLTGDKELYLHLRQQTFTTLLLNELSRM